MPARTALAHDAQLPIIFEQAQVSTANHQKNFVALSKLHHEAAMHLVTVNVTVNDGKDVQLVGEKAFEDIFIDMVLRILPLKKGTTVVDRLVKFIGGYVKFISEKGKDGDEKQKSCEKDGSKDTMTSRFIARLLRYLLKGFEAKDKNVRFRVIQIVAEMSSHLTDIDHGIYSHLHESLMVRVQDKEAPVRAQAVIALAKLSIPDLEDGSPTVTDVLIDVLTHDQAPEVRRAAMLSLPLSELSIPSILLRTRDIDATIRKHVYLTVLEQFENPKQLTIAQRELVVKHGLSDREPAVRAAACKLVGNWVDATGDILEFIKSFDLMESEVVEDALLSAFETRPDIFDNITFGDAFWQELTPEKAFLARVFVEHCLKIKDDTRIESTMPVVTALAFKIQASYNELLRRVEANEEAQMFRDEDDETRERKEADLVDREFVMGEMLKLAVNLDYADEIGRRKMFALVKDMISHDALPDNLVSGCLDVLRILSSSERDLIRVVVEVIHDLRDPDEDLKDVSMDRGNDGENTPMTVRTPARPPKPPVEMSPEEKQHADAIDLRCLSLCIGMLERVNSTFEENSTLEGILGELIIPAVKREEMPLREKGLICLGLCCLIARGMALNSFQLFLRQVQSAPEPLKVRVLQIIFDILMVHEGDFLGNADVGGGRVIDFLTVILESEDSEKVQTILCMGLAKLMLSGMVSDEKVLKSLVLAYVSPHTNYNQELRQCLSYFFPVYCYSSSTNQRRMQTIFMPMFKQLSQMRQELDEECEMVSSSQIGVLLVDWTDPSKAVEIKGKPVDKAVHVDLAIEIVKELFSNDMKKDDKKVMCQLLGKLFIPDDVDNDKIRLLKLLMNNIRSRRPLRDTTSKNAFARFDGTVSKRFQAQLENFNEEEFRQIEYLKDLFEFLDDIIPDDEEEEYEMPAGKRGGRKRRSGSVATTTTAATVDDDDYDGTPEPRSKGNGKSQTKRRRISRSDDESGVTEGDTPPPVPKRTMPRRAAATAKKPIIEVIPDSESEEDSDDEVEDEGHDDVPAAKFRLRPSTKDKNTSAFTKQLDAKIDAVLALDSDLEHDDEEGEVDNLLG